MTRESPKRIRIVVRGAVQGVGFRPFVFRLATKLGLAGWVANGPQGVCIEAEGARDALEGLLLRIQDERPPRACIHGLEWSFLDPAGYAGFEIRASLDAGPADTAVLPDIATCAECRREIFDPHDRRHRYPFTNCTNCGPRFTIIETVPYDRAATTMRGFRMCPACRAEYEDPRDRRFHAQPNACPACGPHLALWDSAGRVLAERDEALRRCAEAIGSGLVVAVKGIGGFHLMADACSDRVVRRLRARKRRQEKPFAVMAPSLDWVQAWCEVSPLERRLLCSPEAPIVLLRRTGDAPGAAVAAAVAPDNPYLGVMLPYTPLHHLLLADLGAPVVATSGNLSDEPICTDEREALRRLGGLADLFLVHDRPILRHADDSVVRVVLGRELVLRRARGYAPLPVRLSRPLPPILAVGGHLKNTVAVSIGKNVVISQPLGDLDRPETADAFRAAVGQLQALHGTKPEGIACDLHPGYRSTRYAEDLALPLHRVQHHHAHVVACMAENQVEGPVLGVAWDGTGYGPDGTIWGGEFLVADAATFRRAAALRRFRLPGADAAVREPRRAALGLLYELLGDTLFERDDLAPVRAFDRSERRLLRRMLARGLNAPVTSSAGRLFDAVASLVGLRQRAGFEGQAAMELEFAAEGGPTDERYPVRITGCEPDGSPWTPDCLVDWEPTVRSLLDDVRGGMPVPLMAARVHNTLAAAIAGVAARLGQERVVLTGGCFQNRYLLARAVACLKAAGCQPYWHQRVPPNDGGLALGQAVVAAHQMVTSDGGRGTSGVGPASSRVPRPASRR